MSDSTQVLLNLIANSGSTVRAMIAADENVDVSILRVLADDADWAVRAQVAASSVVTEELLGKLVDDSDTLVREEVAFSTKMVSRLEHLAKDTDRVVRQAVAQNTETPGDVLSILAKDADCRVAMFARRHFNLRWAAKR